MSGHKLDVDVQVMAGCIQTIRKHLDLMEKLFQKSLIEEVKDGDNVDKRVDGVG